MDLNAMMTNLWGILRESVTSLVYILSKYWETKHEILIANANFLEKYPYVLLSCYSKTGRFGCGWAEPLGTAVGWLLESLWSDARTYIISNTVMLQQKLWWDCK